MGLLRGTVAFFGPRTQHYALWSAYSGVYSLCAVTLCAVVVSRGGSSRSSVALFALGAEPSADLRLALALEVSKKRFNKANMHLERLHLAMKDDFVALKEWAVEKEQARAQLEKVIAENDPSMSIDSAATSEYSQPGKIANTLRLSTTKDAREERASQLPKHAAAAHTQTAAVPVRQAHAHDKVVDKFKSELGEMIEQQKGTQREVSSLTQKMTSMMASQVITHEKSPLVRITAS